MIFRKICFGILVVAAAGMLPCSPTIAQTTDLGRIEDEIRRNAELIREAEQLVSESNSTKARSSLQAAIFLHKESLHLVSNKQLLLAARAAQKAREAVLHAIALAKMEAKTEEAARRTIERAHRRLETAKNLLEESAIPETNAARKLIDEAKVQLHRSIDNMREHLFAAAQQLAGSSERLSMQAITLLKKTHEKAIDVQRELAKTDRVLQRIESHDGMNQNASAEKLYLEALELQAQANQNFRSDRPKRAIELSQRARTMALSAGKLLTSSPNVENVEQAIALSDGLLDRAREMASGNKSETAEQKLAGAFELQEQAKSYFSNKNYAQALRLTLRARERAKEGIGKLQKPPDEEDVEAAIRSTDSLIERVSGRLTQSGHQTEQELFQRLIAHQESAWAEFKEGNMRSALTRTKLARNLAGRILERIDE